MLPHLLILDCIDKEGNEVFSDDGEEEEEGDEEGEGEDDEIS